MNRGPVGPRCPHVGDGKGGAMAGKKTAALPRKTYEKELLRLQTELV
ncbi:hypothetical protein [Streptomyces sp. NBC_00474]|nr:hypothetical protein [Streptomyces sp. NBC_00474]MCX5052210.1 hypothetical protein [Streptomyces sp. NBC_00474]